MKHIFAFFVFFCPISLWAVVDTITLVNHQVLAVDIKSISAKEIYYRDLNISDGPDFVLSTDDVATIKFKNGYQRVYNAILIEAKDSVDNSKLQQETTTSVQKVVQEIKNDISLCRVSKSNNLYVFNDSEPVANYEVIGEVTINNLSTQERIYSTSQYQGLRDALIKAAKMANTQAEGVIFTMVNGGIDKAHIIKFTSTAEDHSLARAKRYRGIYIFCDCEPLGKYKYVGNLNGKFTFNPQYTVLRDDLVKKCVKKYKDADGIRLHLVRGGKDTAEAIKL